MEIKLDLDIQGKGKFYINDGEVQLAEMAVGISGDYLTVYHTEVSPKGEGKGLAKQLLAEMVGYVRSHKLQVIPVCAFVHAQFKRHPDEYADIWAGARAADQ